MAKHSMGSSSLSSPHSSPSDQSSSPAVLQAGLVQNGSATEPSSQPPPATASRSGASTPHAPNMSAKRAPRPTPQATPQGTPQHTPQASPKRAREEEDNEEIVAATTSPKRARSDSADDKSDAFEPPVRRPVAKGKGKGKGKARAPAKKAASKAKSTAAPRKPAVKKPVVKKAAPASPLPSTRPSRTRKAPERFENYEEPASARPTPVKKGTGKVFDPTYITTNSNSRLTKADVYHMLLEPSAWTSLTAAQQSSLISMLPSDAANTALLSRIQTGGMTGNTRPRAFTMNDCFRTDVAKFKEDLKNGHLAKTWLAAAQQAVVQRKQGDFEEWKKEEAERWWGQKGN